MLSLAILVVSLDITILNVALPTLSNSLHAGTSQLQWIVDAYSLALAAAMLPAGLLGDRFGRKRVLLGGLVILVAGSMASAMATSVGELIAARIVPFMGGLLVAGGLAGPAEKVAGTRSAKSAVRWRSQAWAVSSPPSTPTGSARLCTGCPPPPRGPLVSR